jgi:transposase-like protein
MATPEVERLKASLATLSADDLRHLIGAAQAALKAKEKPDAPRPPCPQCQNQAPIRWGIQCGQQRWRCEPCGITYNARSGSPLAGMSKADKFIEAADDMLSSHPLSCRKLGEKLHVHRMTVWRWRHRVLRGLAGGDGRLSDLVEADETFFRESRKGSREWSEARNGGPKPSRPRWRDFDRDNEQMPRGTSRWQAPVLVLRDRHGRTVCRRLPSLRIEAFEPILDEALLAEAMLCTDGGAVYRRWAKSRGRVVEQINTKKGIRVRNGVFHIQNANAYHSRLKEFMRPFRGPSIRNLDLYIRWMTVRDKLREKPVCGNPLLDQLSKAGWMRDPTRTRQPPHPPNGPAEPRPAKRGR